jgi:3-hydroxyisobutyrate dehydrogenase-like beta-hydroxyacid dehydrogenase
MATALRAQSPKSDEERYSPQFPIRLMNKNFGLILNLVAAVGA